MVRERTVEHRLSELTHQHGGIAFKWVSPGRIGVPDRLIILPGKRLFMVELKQPGGKPRPSQLAMHEKLQRLGWPVYVVDDADRFFQETVDACDSYDS